MGDQSNITDSFYSTKIVTDFFEEVISWALTG